MTQQLSDSTLAQLFTEARTQYDWDEAPLPADLLRKLYDLLKFGPTAANSTPARLIFCTSPEAKAKLAACASGNNSGKILLAPATVIVGMDLEFYEKLPELFPHADARSWFVGNAALAQESAFRNSSLQGAYLILAARALGLDTGPMSGFDKAKVDAEFWAGTRVETNFICSIGKGTGKNVFPRLPRLAFEDACRID